MPFPRRITSASLAKFVGWRTERVTRCLRALGIAKKDFGRTGAQVFVQPEDLAAVWPDMYEVLLENLDAIPAVQDGRGRRKNVSKNKSVAKQTQPVYDYDAHPCSYEVGGGWSCAPECDNPDHK